MRYQLGAGLSFSRTMKILIGMNLAIWLLGQVILENYVGIPVLRHFALFPGKVILDGSIWQLVTYMFLHSQQVSHLVLNMLMLWFMGAELEQKWGSKFFLIYYFCSGVGAALLYVASVWLYATLTGSTQGLVIPVIGASGAIFGLMLAYGVLFGDRVVHFMMLFPMQAKYFVMLLGVIEILSMISNGIAGGEVANLAHLGGLVSGYFTLLIAARMKQRSNEVKKQKKNKPGLRLVVDNEKEDSDKQNPRYWN